MSSEVRLPTSAIELEKRVRERWTRANKEWDDAVAAQHAALVRRPGLFEIKEDKALFRYGHRTLELPASRASALCRKAAILRCRFPIPPPPAPLSLAREDLVPVDLAADVLGYRHLGDGDEVFVDDKELVHRLMRAEEHLALVEALIAPTLNNRDERRAFQAHLASLKQWLSVFSSKVGPQSIPPSGSRDQKLLREDFEARIRELVPDATKGATTALATALLDAALGAH